MNIYSQPGEKVIFSYPTAGHKHDQDKVLKYLTLNETYTVKELDVESYHTDVFLEEFPDIAFNSVHFTNKDSIESNIDFESSDIEIVSKIDYLKELATERGFIIRSGENKAFIFQMVAVAEGDTELEAVEKAIGYIFS